MQLQRSLLVLSLVTAALSERALAQSTLSASQTHVLAARATPSASGTAAGQLFAASRASVGLSAQSLHANSANYLLDAGMASIQAQLSPGAPLIAGLSPDGGDSDGGALTKVFGFNLQDAAGPTTVLIAGSPPASVAEQSNTWLRVVTVAGENAFGNPLGPVDVEVQTSLGSDTAEGAYVYRPALIQQSPACFGCTLSLRLETTPGAFHMLALGFSVPGVAIPIPPIEGGLEIWNTLKVLKPLAPTASGTATYLLPVPQLTVSPFPAEFQAVALDSLAPLGGSFTNRLTVTIGQP